MGLGSSKHTASGSLPGAYAPPLAGASLPAPLSSSKKFKLEVPSDNKSGDTMVVVALHGENVTVRIPRRNASTGNPIKPGDAFRHASPSEIDKVIASTLPTIPGMEIVQSKPVLWAIVSEAFFRFQMTNDQKEQTHMAKI
jgi:hypothetical protein